MHSLAAYYEMAVLLMVVGWGWDADDAAVGSGEGGREWWECGLESGSERGRVEVAMEEGDGHGDEHGGRGG